MTTINYLVKTPLVAACIAFSSLAPAATLTDRFDNRPVATGSQVAFTGDSTSATFEASEPSHGGTRHHSVWGAWTAPENGEVTIDSKGSAFDTVLAIYVGDSLAGLLPVAQNSDVQSDFEWSSVSFPTKAGVTYSFAVDGQYSSSNSGQGSVAINVDFRSSRQPGAEVGTDLFAMRPLLSSNLQAIGVCNTRLAGIEVDEKGHVGTRNHTVWWKWLAPVNGLVTIETLGSDFDTTLTVYVGSFLNVLSEVAINNDAPNVEQSRVIFQAYAGMEYQIMVDGAYNSSSSGDGNVKLKLVQEPNVESGGVPGADLFSQRGSLEGLNPRGVANSTFFSIELNEPSHGSTRNHTAWWRWVAPAEGTVDIRTEGSDFDTFLAIYTGSTLGNMQMVAKNDDALNVKWSQVRFLANRGTEYQIMVDGTYNSSTSGQGNIVVSVKAAVPAINTLALYPALEVEIPGNQGVIYQLQASEDLVEWINVGEPIRGKGAPIRVLDSVQGTNKRFYRYLAAP